MHGGAQERADLRRENLLQREAEAHAAQSERRARAVDAGVVDRELGFAHVEGADRHRVGRGTGDETTVGRVLRFLGEPRLAGAGQQELRAEQADSLGSVFHRAHGIVGRFNVRLQADVNTVGRDAGKPAEFVERLLVGFVLASTLLDLPHGVVVGIDEHLAGGAVDRDGDTGRHGRAGIVQPGDRGDADGPRQDRGMVRPAAFVADQRGDAMPFELGDQRGGQFVRHQHQRTLEVLECLGGITCGPEVAAQPVDDIGDVPLALAKIRIVAAIEEGRDLGERALKCRLRVEAVARDDLGGALDQHPVVEHQQLCVEEIRMIFSSAAHHASLDLPQLLARLVARGVQPLDLGRDATRWNSEANVADAPAQYDGAADADAW